MYIALEIEETQSSTQTDSMDCCRSRVEGLHGGIARCMVRCYRDRAIYGWGLPTQGCEFLEIERGSLGAGSVVSAPHFGPPASHTRIPDQSSGHYSSSGNQRQIGGHRVMNKRRRARSTEKGGREYLEERTNKESRKRRSWHCGTIHHRVTEASKGAQFGTLKIPLSSKVTNDTSGRISGANHMSWDTPISHGRLFWQSSQGPTH
ncbi:hypothetical protein CDL15_Pgr024835 [Punica granatum]|uniref:Uncharacterized protein n=1 Tax=Punica granatum TaxID=22663 RepID=A0A218WJN8_PUNGR|nr:hypothetical protein CDL15_Pgr024835 [Punica granatum]